MDQYYGHKKIGGDGGYYFFHVYSNIHQTEMCGDDSIYELTLSEDNSDDEWGWDLRHLWGFLRTGETRYTMIYPILFHLEMCFPGGLEDAEERGKGHRVKLYVEKYRRIE